MISSASFQITNLFLISQIITKYMHNLDLELIIINVHISWGAHLLPSNNDWSSSNVLLSTIIRWKITQQLWTSSSSTTEKYKNLWQKIKIAFFNICWLKSSKSTDSTADIVWNKKRNIKVYAIKKCQFWILKKIWIEWNI